jgi:5'-nucleotidase
VTRPARILVVNDDGIHAPGLDVLAAIAAEIGDEVWVVAPESDQSGVSHSVSLNDPLRLRHVGERRYAVRGTPTDCVIMGVRHLMEDNPPDLVLSGVNRGRNVAEDVSYSGTIAGAIEGAFLGIPSIALSQCYRRGASEDKAFDCAAEHGAKVVWSILEAGIGRSRFINVNFPPCAPELVEGVRVTRQGRRDETFLRIEGRRDGRNNPYYWVMYAHHAQNDIEGTDLWALSNNFISVTPLKVDQTDEAQLEGLASAFR